MHPVWQIYLETRKTREPWWNWYVARPLGAAVVYVLRNTAITPNQVTLISFASAVLACGVLVLVPGPLGTLAGILTLQLSYVFDCADGMLARHRKTSSVVGHHLDFLMDELKAFLMMAAVGIRLYLGAASVAFLLVALGGLVGLASGIGLTTFLRRPEVSGPSAPGGVSNPQASSPLRHAVRWAEMAGQFWIHYPSHILFFAIAQRLDLFLYVYAGVNVAYAGRAFLQVVVRHGLR